MSDATPTATDPTLDLDHIDYRALTDPITSQQVAVFRAKFKADARGNPNFPTTSKTVTTIFSIAFIVIFAAIFLSGVGFSLGAIVSESGHQSGPVSIGGAVVVIGFLIVAVVILRRVWGSHENWPRWMRMSGFARDNGLRFESSPAPTIYPGSVFTVGSQRAAYEHFTSISGRYLDFGTYRYVTGSGKSRATHTWGYLAIQLDRNLPNMVLDSKSNNGLFGSTDLPATFRRDQVLSLEGDFDKYFTLYCPTEYKQDALYVFTPDLMALLIDDAAPFDVEIVDNWMFLYSTRVFPPLDPASYQRLFTIVRTVGSKAISQSRDYRDDRLVFPSDNIVAPAGQRLRHGVSIGSLVVFGGIGAFWLWSMISGFVQN